LDHFLEVTRREEAEREAELQDPLFPACCLCKHGIGRFEIRGDLWAPGHLALNAPWFPFLSQVRRQQRVAASLELRKAKKDEQSLKRRNIGPLSSDVASEVPATRVRGVRDAPSEVGSLRL
jgi:hypothetical protein